jgi:hypothetical protein
MLSVASTSSVIVLPINAMRHKRIESEKSCLSRVKGVHEGAIPRHKYEEDQQKWKKIEIKIMKKRRLSW